MIGETIWVGAGYNFRRSSEMKLSDGESESAHGAGLSVGGGLTLQRFKLQVAYAKYHVSASSLLINATREVGYVYVDTGAMYRCVTLFALRNGLFAADGSIDEAGLRSRMNDIHISFKFNPEAGRPDTYLNGELVERDIRTMEVSSHVSPIATLGFVREAMVAQQQEMGRGGGVVMDGRDIGTVVFPNAELKIFVTASAVSLAPS